MPIGTITPNARTAVTPSAAPVMPTAASGPGPGTPVIAQDVLDAWLAILDTAACAIDGRAGGTYDPTDWIVIQGGNSRGIKFDTDGSCAIGSGGWLDIVSGGKVSGHTGSEWGGTFPFVAGAITLDATSTLTVLSGGEIDGASGSKFGGQWNYLDTSTVWHRGDLHVVGHEYIDDGSVVTYSPNATINGTLNFAGAFNSENAFTFKTGGYGAVVETGVAIDCYNGGGHVFPKAAPYVAGGGTVTPFTPAAAIPEIIDLTLTADTTIVIPVGTEGQVCEVTVANDGGGYTATLNFQGTSLIATTLRNATSGTTHENVRSVKVRSNGSSWRYVNRSEWFA